MEFYVIHFYWIMSSFSTDSWAGKSTSIYILYIIYYIYTLLTCKIKPPFNFILLQNMTETIVCPPHNAHDLFLLFVLCIDERELLIYSSDVEIIFPSNLNTFCFQLFQLLVWSIFWFSQHTIVYMQLHHRHNNRVLFFFW